MTEMRLALSDFQEDLEKLTATVASNDVRPMPGSNRDYPSGSNRIFTHRSRME